MITWGTVLELWCASDGRMDDGQKKRDIEVGAPPKKGIKLKASPIIFSLVRKNLNNPG